MMHPLDGALKRIRRADVHIRRLTSIIERFRKANQKNIVAHKQLEATQLNLKPGQKLTTVQSQTAIGLPEDIPIIVGETIYNLRAALDYLIYELAIKDSGSPQPGTQFLIEDIKTDPHYPQRGFDWRSKKCLAGLSKPHVEAIEALQPYVGCKWAQTLRDISNPDKHRHLTAVVGRWNEMANFECGISGAFDNLPGMILRGRGGIYTDDYFHLEYTVEITFPDGTPVIKTLEFVKNSVTGVLKIFESEF